MMVCSKQRLDDEFHLSDYCPQLVLANPIEMKQSAQEGRRNGGISLGLLV
jgi:hypothetical protein